MDAKLKYLRLGCDTGSVVKVALLRVENANRCQMAAGFVQAFAPNRDEFERPVRELPEKPQTVAKARV